MAKKQFSCRISDAAEAALDSLAVSSGQSATDCVHEAIRCWARSIDRASTEIAEQLSPREWGLIADVLNGTLIDPGWSEPGRILAGQVEDAHKLDGTGYSWLADVLADEASQVVADRAVASLVRKLEALDLAQGWAVLHAARWFWQNPEVGMESPWWLPSFRRRYGSQEKQTEG